MQRVSVRGSGGGNRRTHVKRVSVWWLDGITFQSDLEPQKVHKCEDCVTCASDSKNADKVRVRASICAHPPFGLPLSDCQFEDVYKLIRVASTSCPELVFFRLFSKWVAGTYDVASYCDCRLVREDEESHRGDLDETDHVHEDNHDHCSASNTEDCLAMFSLFHCTMCLYSGCSSAFTVSLPPRW